MAVAGTTFNIRIVLTNNAGDFRRDMDGAGQSGARAGQGIGAAGEAAEQSGKKLVSLGGLAREAAANFAGYLSAQAVFQGLSKAVEFAKDTILGFDNEMTQSLAIMGNVSAETRKSMETTARQVAVQYNTAVQDVAQAYYYLASAGYDAATSQAALGQVTAFAKAGMFDLETATSLAADAQNAMGLKSADAQENLVQLTRITDVLTKANIDANGSVEDFAKALTNKAAAGARLAGVSLEETTAVLEAFAAQGLKGKRAGEAFTIVLRDLQDKSQTNSKAFEQLGIKVYDSKGAFAGFPSIVGQLENALKGMSVEQANATINTLGFTAEGGAYLKTLLGMSGAISDYQKKLESAGGATQAIAEKQMTSMIERLKHIQALAAELSLLGFEKLVQAVNWLNDHFGPALEKAGKAAGDALSFIRPMVEALAKLAAVPVVATLTAFAATLDKATSILAEHSGIVQALATVGLVLLVAKLAQAGAAFLSMAADAAAFKIYDWAGGIDKALDAFVAMKGAFTAARAEGAGFFGAMQAGMAALGASTTALAVGGLVALGLIIYGVTTKLNDGERAANDFIRAISIKHDTASLQGLRDQLAEVTAEMEKTGKMGSTMGERINIPAMIEAEGKYNKLKDTVKELGDQLDLRQKSFHDIAAAILESSDPAVKTTANMDALVKKLDEIATKEKIDPTAPGAADRLNQLATAALFTDPTIQALHRSFTEVADASSTAEDALKAYQQALQALIGVHISAQQAENAFAQSLDDVHGKLFNGINLMDAYGAKNREGREAVLSAADAAMKHAVSVYEETGSLDKANATLGFHREQLIQAMVASGMSRKAAEDYINTLNLTPKNIETLARLNKDQASGAALELIAQENEAARHRQGSIDIDTSTASGKIRALLSQMDDVSRRQARQMGLSSGGIIRAYASGGVERYASGGERHVAQIAPAGAWRLWAEPETGGEAYIPLSLAKRVRSMAILKEVASMFGATLVPNAGGNLHSIAGQTVLRGGQTTYAMQRIIQLNMAPGMMNVVVGPGANMAEVERLVQRALAQFSRGLQRELRTRRVERAA